MNKLPQTLILKDQDGFQFDAGRYHLRPDQLLLTITGAHNVDHVDGVVSIITSLSCSLTFTQVVRLSAFCRDWLSIQAADVTSTAPADQRDTAALARARQRHAK